MKKVMMNYEITCTPNLFSAYTKVLDFTHQGHLQWGVKKVKRKGIIAFYAPSFQGESFGDIAMVTFSLF